MARPGGDVRAAAELSGDRPGTGQEGPRTAIRCRWHDAGVAGAPPAAPGKQAATGFALYGLRLRAEGISSDRLEARTLGTATATAARPGSSVMPPPWPATPTPS